MNLQVQETTKNEEAPVHHDTYRRSVEKIEEEDDDDDDDNFLLKMTTTLKSSSSSSSLRQQQLLVEHEQQQKKFPQTESDILAIEQILANEMAELSLVERDKILFDIHGLSHIEEVEDPNQINELLLQMELHLLNVTTTTGEGNKKMKESSSRAYEEAKIQNSKYVTNKNFRLMFLRSAEYNPTEAANQMLKHFEIKKDIFCCGSCGSSSSSLSKTTTKKTTKTTTSSSSSSNNDILGRDICLSDLSNNDIECLRSGFIQICPSRDLAGRTIIFMAPRYRKCQNLDNMARALWYFKMATIQNDDEYQRKGIILVVYNTINKHKYNIKEQIQFVQKILSLRPGIPEKLMGCHFCGLDSKLRPFVTGVKMMIFGKELRTRIKDHFGSYQDIIFRMQTFGIKAEDHPLKEDGTLSLDWHHEWISIREAQEENRIKQQKEEEESTSCSNSNNNSNFESTTYPSGRIAVLSPPTISNLNPKQKQQQQQQQGRGKRTTGVIVPRRFDVLFGRSKQSRNHTGNLRVSHLCDMYQQQYDTATKFDKRTLIENIIDIVHDSDGRFLKYDSKTKTGWYEVDRDTARNKVSHFFRLKRAASNANANTKPQMQEQQKAIASSTKTLAMDHHHEFNQTTTSKSKRRITNPNNVSSPSSGVDDSTTTTEQQHKESSDEEGGDHNMKVPRKKHHASLWQQMLDT